jgi:hypothetical protein
MSKSTFRTRIDELARILEGHQADEEEALAAGRLLTFANALNRDTQRLSALAEAVEEGARVGSAVSAPPGFGDLLQALEEAERGTREDVLAVGRGDRPEVVGVAAKVVEELTRRVDDAWAELREADPPPVVDPELLDLIALEEPELASRFEAADARLYLLREKPRPGPGDIDAWSETVAILREVELAVAAHASSPALIEFLRDAASARGATIAQFDHPDVREWLSRDGRDDRYRVFARKGRRS